MSSSQIWPSWLARSSAPGNLLPPWGAKNPDADSKHGMKLKMESPHVEQLFRCPEVRCWLRPLANPHFTTVLIILKLKATLSAAALCEGRVSSFNVDFDQAFVITAGIGVGLAFYTSTHV